MRWKLSSLITLGCCLATSLSVYPQSGPGGISVIVVPTEAAAEELRSRIRDGDSFEMLATAYSTDSTASRGGYMGVVEESTLMRKFRAALDGLKAGSISTVTPVGDSFVLLKRTTAEEDLWRSQCDKGHAAVKQGLYPTAASLFLTAIQQAEAFGKDDVRLAESLNGLSQVYRYQQNFAEAEPPARRSLVILERAYGNSHEALLPSLLNLAGIARAGEKYSEAEHVYRRILAIRWGTSRTTGTSADQVLDDFAEVLSLAQTRDPRLDKAFETFWRSVAGSNLNKDVFAQMRDRLMTAQLVPEAESLMLRAVRLYPDSRQLKYRLGELYVTWGKYEKAIEVFEDAARLNTSSDLDRTQRSRIYERIGEMNFLLVRFDDAVNALTRSLEINPANTGSRLLLGAIFTRRNRFTEAAAEYRRVITTNPASASAYDGLAQVELSLGNYREAALEADKALAIDPDLQTARYNRAIALIRDGREEGTAALEEYQRREAELRSVQTRRNDVAHINRTATNLLSEGSPEKAVETLREGIKVHSLSGILYLKLGMAQSLMKLHKDAAGTFETMIRLKIDDFLVHRQLGREYELLGNSERAQQQRMLYLQRYDAALQANPN
jgi:tetratricopeptide (TPR) repeat protein